MAIKDLRKIWQDFKKAFEQQLGPTLGDKWTRKAFSLGLGPTLDEVVEEFRKTERAWNHAFGFIKTADKGDFFAINEVQSKMASVLRHAEKTDKLVDKALRKLQDYQNLVQQGLTETQQRGALTPDVHTTFRKAMGTMSDIRDGLVSVQRRCREVYILNAQHWCKVYRERMQRR